MVDPEPTREPRSPALLVLGAIAIVLAILGSLAAFFLWPRGERVGVLDLREPAPRLDVELAAGDTLNVRLDVTVGTTTGYPSSSRSRANAVHAELAASEITVTLALDGRTVTSATCRAYDDKATTVSSGSDDVESSGLPLRCALEAQKAGLHAVTSRVTWVPKDVRAAKLEVRRQRAGQ